MTLADELAQVNADLEHDGYPKSGVTRSTIRRAVEALRAADNARRWLKVKADKCRNAHDYDSYSHGACDVAEDALLLLDERPSAAERSGGNG